MKYVRSTDNGRTWQSSATLTGDRWSIAPLDRPDNMNEIYIGQLRHEPATRAHRERVAIVYTLAGGGPEGHLHDRYHRNVYYAYVHPGRPALPLGGRARPRHHRRRRRPGAVPEGGRPPAADGQPALARLHQPGRLHARRADAVRGVDADRRAGPGARPHRGAPARVRLAAQGSGTGVRVRDMEPADDADLAAVRDAGNPAATGVDTYRLVPGVSYQRESSIATPQPVQRIEVIAGYRDAGPPAAHRQQQRPRGDGRRRGRVRGPLIRRPGATSRRGESPAERACAGWRDAPTPP